ncbi:UNVERIFIED_CONTAM: tRNA (guanine-N(7)-)-methyltransferase [Sesamum angustifolium]|uniref:tRNA (guanine(46)-N(7))-methyltransferase n=1 Tax=Sesamum angustifolium TaxID=2727405 RepID=A0AAW2N7S9_9LAMI
MLAEIAKGWYLVTMGCISCAIPRFLRPTTTVSQPLKLQFFAFHCRTVSPPAAASVYPALFSPEREEIRSPELVAREYADLNLSDKFCQVPVEVPDWDAVYNDATLPLMVDIGSGSGRFLLWLAQRNAGSRNYLGLEIRPKLVKRAEYWVDELALKNISLAGRQISWKMLHASCCGFAASKPESHLYLQCPDPHFKKKHHKRRVVQTPLVESIVDGLVAGGQIFIQSDVLEVALDMRDYFDAESDKLAHIDRINPTIPCDDEGWLLNNPMGIRTEREIHAEFEGARIYRRMYQKQW